MRTRCAASIAVLLSVGLGLLLLPGSAQTSPEAYRTFRPDGPGPHPSVAFVPGCGGFASSMAPRHYERVAEQFRARGYVVIFVDPFGRRSVKGCTDPGVTVWDAAKDLVSAAAWLKSQPFVDQARITAVGWGWGGTAVLTDLADYAEEQLVFSRAIAYYPNCQRVRPWKVRLPVLILLGGDDDMVRAAPCHEVAKQSAAPAMVKIVVYPGAQNSFDMSELPAKSKTGFGTVGYHPQAAAAAWEEVQRFLRVAR